MKGMRDYMGSKSTGREETKEGMEIGEIGDEGVGEDVRTKYRNERNERNVRLNEIGANKERGNE